MQNYFRGEGDEEEEGDEVEEGDEEVVGRQRKLLEYCTGLGKMRKRKEMREMK